MPFDFVSAYGLVPFTSKALGIDGIQKLLVWRHRDKEWILHIGGAVNRREGACFRVELKSVNGSLFTGRKGGDENNRALSMNKLEWFQQAVGKDKGY